MKNLNIYVLLALLSFSASKAEQGNSDLEELEKEYTACVENAEKLLFENATKEGNIYPYDANFKVYPGMNHYGKFVHNRYKQQCAKCLATYKLKAKALLKLQN